jgi:hypothetical protein
MRPTTTFLLALTVLAGAWLGAPTRAAAQTAADGACQVFEIEASNDDGGMDDGLGPFKAKLSKPPFNAWKRFRLLDKHDRDVEVKKPFEVELRTGGALGLLLRDKIEQQGKKTRLRLSATMKDKAGKITLETTTLVDAGDGWLIAGESMPGNKGATYVVGILCTAR